jgi:hypothetical protein
LEGLFIMARTTTTAAAPLAFVAADYALATKSAVTACNAVDKATANASAHVQKWAVASAAGMLQQALTLDTIKSGLVAATPMATRKANVAASGRDIGTDSLEACGATIKSHFYTFQRIAKGNALDRLLKGEAFNTVARSLGAVQEQAKGKRSSTKAASSDVTGDTKADDVKAIPIATTAVGELSDAINAVAGRIAAAKVSTLTNSVNDAALANLVSVIAKAQAMVAAHKKAVATAPKARKPRAIKLAVAA